MSWRVVVVTKSAKLEYSMEYLVVRDAESTEMSPRCTLVTFRCF